MAGHQREDAQAFVRHVTSVRIEAISTPMPVKADGEALGTSSDFDHRLTASCSWSVDGATA